MIKDFLKAFYDLNTDDRIFGFIFLVILFLTFLTLTIVTKGIILIILFAFFLLYKGLVFAGKTLTEMDEKDEESDT